MTQTLKQKARLRSFVSNGEMHIVKKGVPSRAWFRLSRLLENAPTAYLVRDGRGWRAVSTVSKRSMYYNHPPELFAPLWSPTTINTLISQGTLDVLERDEDGRPLRARHWEAYTA